MSTAKSSSNCLFSSTEECMSKLAEKVQEELIQALEKDELVLPTLPEVAIQVREAAEDPNISTLSLSKVIGQDAALTARLIKVVNSPLMRSNREITDLQMAIGRLGILYRSEEHTSELQSRENLVCRLLLE